jgi:hypothetical protein
MARFVIIATVECPRLFVRQIPRKLALELEKPKYRRLGIRLESIEIEGMKE